MTIIGKTKMERFIQTVALFSLASFTLLGCAKTYQPTRTDTLDTQLANYEGQRISIVGVPSAPGRYDFLAPMPLREGKWTLVVNDVRCTETINFENEPRLRSMQQIAAAARKDNRPIEVSGVVKAGQLEMEFFEGTRTDTAWYKNRNPYYAYSEYYEWYPFAYSPNSHIRSVVGKQ